MKHDILKNEFYLYMTEFFAGMSVMAVELGASRLMAPYFSSSQIVWTIIISTIMIAMALGNIFGGRWADRDPDPGRLYRRILIAAVWIAAIPLLGKYVILGITGLLVITINQNFLTIAAFCAAMVIFVYPCFLLGTCTPSLARYCVDNVDDSGKTVGTLGAYNTVGSIIGTFLPTFVTIPAVGTAITFLIFSGVLLVLSLIYFISKGAKSGKSGNTQILREDAQDTQDIKDAPDEQYIQRNTDRSPNDDELSATSDDRQILSGLRSAEEDQENRRSAEKIQNEQNLKPSEHAEYYEYYQGNMERGNKPRRKRLPDKAFSIICCVLFAICTVFGHSDSFAFWEDDLVYEGESIYNYLQVKEDSSRVVLSTNVLFGVQSVMMKTDSMTGMYYDYAMAAPIMADSINKRNPRMLILGMGTGTFARQCGKYAADLGEMEINGVEIDEKITQLAKTYFDEPQSAIITTYDGRAYLDADDTKYDVIMVDAYQDITIPFQMSSVEFFTSVREHLTDDGVMVVNMNMRTGTDEGINNYLQDTIASVFPYVKTADVSGNTNRELFASVNEVTDSEFRSRAAKIKDDDLREMMMRIGDNLVSYEGGDNIFTDDKAPVELLGMRAIDKIISDEIGYYKDVFRNEGIDGILEAM